MTTPDHIHYLRRGEIDTVKWDACIDAARNGLIYGRSFYLDGITAGQWDALVLGDYQAIMPLTWNRKFGFHYLYQPFCTPCLGLFEADPQQMSVASSKQASMNAGPKASMASFLGAIPKKFKYWDIDLNEANKVPEIAPVPPSVGSAGLAHFKPVRAMPLDLPLKTSLRINHLLLLDKKGEELEQGYHRLARRMCRRATDAALEVIRDIGPRDVIDRYRGEYGSKHTRVGSASYERLALCAEKAFRQGHARTYLALWPDGGIAAFYLLFSDKRFVYSVLGGSTQKGKEEGAFYLLTDAAIKDHAATNRIFRFEGSDIPGIASFDASFGSTPVSYPHLLMNKLPFPINLLK